MTFIRGQCHNNKISLQIITIRTTSTNYNKIDDQSIISDLVKIIIKKKCFELLETSK